MSRIESVKAKKTTDVMIAAAHVGEHPQLAVPFDGYLGSTPVDGVSMSLTHAVVEGDLDASLVETVVPFAARVNFIGFSLLVYMDVWVEKTGAGEYTLRYTDPTGEHLPSLRYLLNSYIAGDVVSLGGVMNYSGPLAAKSRKAAPPPSPMFRLKAIAWRIVMVFLGLGLAWNAANIVQDRVLFSYEAQPVTIAREGKVLRATTAGQLAYVDTEAGPGEALYAIVTPEGDYYSVEMPCDCAVKPLRDFSQGATVMAGMPLVQVSSRDGRLVANTTLSEGGAVRLLAGDTLELVMTDGRVIPVAAEVLPRLDETSGPLQVALNLDGQTGLEPGDLGRLRFRKTILPEPLRKAAADAAGLLGLSQPAKPDGS